jgi:hypothetical protein
MNTKNISMTKWAPPSMFAEVDDDIKISGTIEPINFVKKPNKAKLLEELFLRYKSKMKYPDSKSYSEFKKRITEDESASLADCEAKKKPSWFNKIYSIYLEYTK